MTVRKLIKCGKLFDGVTEEMQCGKEILISDNIIEDVGHNIIVSRDVQKIDLSHLTVTPGMIDAHIHLTFFKWQNKRHENIFNSPAYKTLAALYSAQKAMARGFTTLRHVGCSSFDGYGSIDVKRAINSGYFKGPRLLIAPMYLGVNGGPADHSQALKTNYQMCSAMRECYPSIGCGVDFFTNAVREQQKLGADFIKIMVSGSFYSPDSSPEIIYFRDDELTAIIETAHSLNMPVTSHTYSTSAIQKLIKMHIDGIEHGALIDKETVQMMENSRTYLVPTFCPFDNVINDNLTDLNKQDFSAKLRRYAPLLKEGRKNIVNSNIKLGYGTDIVSIHNNYDCGFEFSCWIRSGMDPYRTLKAATSVNAEILGVEKIGRIAPGYYADIAAWRRDLLKDHEALLDCAFVMKDGEEYQTEPVVY